LHAIDEPATHASSHTHALPHISAAQNMDSVEVAEGSVRHWKVWLLADCWQDAGRAPADPVDACSVDSG
jgi:hypothetical protein